MAHLRRFATSIRLSGLRPLRFLQVVGAESADEAIDSLRKHGAVIVKRLVSAASVAQSLKDIEQSLKQGYLKYKPEDFFQENTSRATGLLTKSPTYAQDQVMHPMLRKISDHFLTTKHQVAGVTWETPPQISSCIAFQIDPGAQAQPLHRDDPIYNNTHMQISSWTEPRDLSREATLSMFVAATESTAENGATRLIPGSHLWGEEEIPEDEDAIHAELEPGDALFMLSSTYHGGSANTTKDQARIVFASSIARGILRQEENQFLVASKEVMSRYPKELQKFAGFNQQWPELGWVSIADTD